jgi:hypothetical protein
MPGFFQVRSAWWWYFVNAAEYYCQAGIGFAGLIFRKERSRFKEIPA